jgi:transcription antitermination factor NusG
MIVPEEKRWYAVYVNSRAEKKVEQALAEKGIEAYVPLVSSVRQWSDRKKKLLLPLLNGYVFVKLNPRENERVLQTRGVVSFVRYCGQLAQIKEEEILRLRQLVEYGFFIEAGSISKTYHKGDKITINFGPLKDLEGYVLEDSSGRYIDIVLESIGQVIKVKLPSELVSTTQGAYKHI